MIDMIILMACVVATTVTYLALGARIVRQGQKGVVERLGRYNRTLDSGFRVIIPVVESIRRMDVREQVVDVPPQYVITKDNVAVEVDAVIYFEITEPMAAAYNVSDYFRAVIKLAQTSLRNYIGDKTLDEALISRDEINEKLRGIMDEATDKWGIRISRVEIQKIDLPGDVTNAMHRQMQSERQRRAAILEAEGMKQAAILTAEGEKRSVELRAEAARYERETVATGEALAIKKVFDAINVEGDVKALLTLKYYEALARISDGPANKVFLPTEAAGMISAVGCLAEAGKGLGAVVSGG